MTSEWEWVKGTWNVFENSHGWRLTLDTERLPSRWSIEERHAYAKAIVNALNNDPELGETKEGSPHD